MVRWLLVLLLWTPLDLAGPLLPLPVEVLEESEETASGSPSRRRDRARNERATAARREELRHDATRSVRLVAGARSHARHHAGTPRKLPHADAGSDTPADVH